MHLRHLMGRVFETPLLIEAEKGRLIAEIVLHRSEGPQIQIDDDEPAPAPNLRGRPYALEHGIAIIPVHGTLVHRTRGIEALSGLMSYEQIQGMLKVALSDPGVRGIVLDISSPGGDVDGAFELADWIHALRGRAQPVWAVGTGKAASAAYVIGRAADRFLVGPGTLTGSIGVLWIHIDQSKAEEEAGLVVTELFHGAFKADGSRHHALGDAERARIEALLGRVYGLFVDRVAAWGGLSADAVRATEAAVYLGADAVAAGLADGVMRMDEAIGALRRTFTPGRSLVSA